MEIEPQKFMPLMAAPPVVLVSTLYGEVPNLAPFGMIMPISSNPPMLAVGIKDSRDTFANIQEVGEFVVGLPGPEIAGQVNITAKPFPRGTSEFEQAGLTPEKSRAVRPFRIKECQTNLECRLAWAKEAGDHYVVVGEVVAASVQDEVWCTRTRDDLNPIYHLGGGLYARRGPKLEREP